MTLSERNARKLVDRVLKQASFGDVRVRIRVGQTGNQRFATVPTTSGDIAMQEVSVTAVTKDGRQATVTGNRTDDASLSTLVQDAEALAELSPVDPEIVPPLGKVSPSNSTVVDKAVSKMDADARTGVVEQALKVGADRKLAVSGFVEHEDVTEAFADRAGLFAYQRRTRVSMTTTARTPDGTGSSRTGFVSHAQSGLDGAALATAASSTAERSASPLVLAPGQYTVVLSPNAVADLLGFLFWALDHRAASEGRSYFAAGEGKTKLGETLFDRRVSLRSDPEDKTHPAEMFGPGGLVHPKVEWVNDGKLLALRAGRYWANQAGVPVRPFPSSVFMKGDSLSPEELIGKVERGVFVTRFWYNRMLDPQQIVATGLTRDGTFFIEDGKVTQPIKNFRYNESPINMLKRVVAMGVPERAGFHPERVWVVPPLVVERFNFSSLSDAV